jgi:hypothetical protein
MSEIKLFISHSEMDKELTVNLANWLQSGVGLEDNEVRCTVLRPPPMGQLAIETLRNDMDSAKFVICLVTHHSERSSWVQFELGAAWLKNMLVPVRGPGVSDKHLREPLSQITSIGYCNTGQMMNLLGKLANAVGKQVNNSAEDQLQGVIESARTILANSLVYWFSLPAVLSARQLDSAAYSAAYFELIHNMGLEDNLRSKISECVNAEGKIIGDPPDLPSWARDVWDLSKHCVNYLLEEDVKNRGTFPSVAAHSMEGKLLGQLQAALDKEENRSEAVRDAFGAARDWIGKNPPDLGKGHGHS